MNKTALCKTTHISRLLTLCDWLLKIKKITQSRLNNSVIKVFWLILTTQLQIEPSSLRGFCDVTQEKCPPAAVPLSLSVLVSLYSSSVYHFPLNVLLCSSGFSPTAPPGGSNCRWSRFSLWFVSDWGDAGLSLEILHKSHSPSPSLSDYHLFHSLVRPFSHFQTSDCEIDRPPLLSLSFLCWRPSSCISTFSPQISPLPLR